MDLIWGNREGKYFYAKDWTGSISLIGFDKFAVRRKGYCAGEEPKPSLRANGSRECAPDDRLREAIHFSAAMKEWIASSLRASQ
jgi:hypothetical protein